MRRSSATLAGLLALVSLAGATGVARAHELGGTRFEAPIPLPLLLVGAGLTVGVTAAVLARADRGDRPPASEDPTDGGEWERSRRLGTVSPTIGRTLRTVVSVGFLAVFVGVLLAGLFGSRNALDNPATLFVWAVWFRGLGLVSALAGSPWRVLAPWRIIYRGFVALEGRTVGPFDYPERLGHWPALVGFLLLLGVGENLTVAPRTVSLTVLVVVAYALVMLAGALLFGPVWFERADPLDVLYRLFGRVAPLRFRRTGKGGYTVHLRVPWGSGGAVADAAVAAFVVAAVYTVSFDGFDGTPEYRTLAESLGRATGLGPLVDLPLYLAGLLAFVGTFALVARLTRSGPTRGALVALAPTVLPIAVAYEVAHNYPYVLSRAGRLVEVLVGVGADPLAWLSVPAFWASQVALVVAGHLVAVVAAHLALRGRPARAEVPLTAAMVGYTVLSLWIISRPVVA
ncbi:hypothetical protein [Halomarina litorea]|uniref:hypothetical protein n=1 Tax=Halomarina litorea TaxID=2961595 RepID=UPI0020C22635|nr:hypothetical protein [Halomarina sp. BCD28]